MVRHAKYIKLSLPIISVLYFISVAIIFGNNSIFTQIGKIFIVFITFTCIISPKYHHPKISNNYIIWSIINWGYFASSFYWSSYPSNTMSMVITYGIVCICVSSLYYLITYTNTTLYKCFRVYIISSIIMALYVIIRFGINLTSSDREFYSQYGLNLNILGLGCAVSIILAFYFYKIEISYKHRNLYKYIILFSMFVVLISGSKKALLLPLIVFMIYNYVKVPARKKLNIIIFSCILIIAGYYILMKIPILYNSIGIRLEGMFNAVLNDGKIDNSTKGRLQFIEYGLILIARKFWFGYGLASYAPMYASTHIGEYASYSHNNYIELMVSGGVIGLIIHYSFYLYLLIKLYKRINLYKSELDIICFSLIFGLLFIHYGMVAYYDWISNILLTLIAVHAFSNQEQTRLKRISQS